MMKRQLKCTEHLEQLGARQVPSKLPGQPPTLDPIRMHTVKFIPGAAKMGEPVEYNLTFEVGLPEGRADEMAIFKVGSCYELELRAIEPEQLEAPTRIIKSVQ